MARPPGPRPVPRSQHARITPGTGIHPRPGLRPLAARRDGARSEPFAPPPDRDRSPGRSTQKSPRHGSPPTSRASANRCAPGRRAVRSGPAQSGHAQEYIKLSDFAPITLACLLFSRSSLARPADESVGQSNGCLYFGFRISGLRISLGTSDFSSLRHFSATGPLPRLRPTGGSAIIGP